MPRRNNTSKQSLFDKSKIRRWFVWVSAVLASTALIITNSKTIFNTRKELFHKNSDDLIIIDNYVNLDTVLTNSFSEDTLEFRLLNTGSKTIALREAHFLVDSVWGLDDFSKNCTIGYEPLSAVYGVILPDSTPPYIIKVKLNQSIKPNESDRFAFTLGGGKQAPYRWEVSDGVDSIIRYHRTNYFVKFKVQFMLDNSKESLGSTDIIHFFGDTTNVTPVRAIKCAGRDKGGQLASNNIAKAIQVNKLNVYKSPAAIITMKAILGNEIAKNQPN